MVLYYKHGKPTWTYTVYVLNAYACVMHVASYMMKTKRQIGELLKGVASEDRSEESITQLCFLKP